jgi:hypothetical protein
MCPTGAIHGVNFPKPLDKDAIKERIKIRQQKAKEAAEAAKAAAAEKPVILSASEESVKKEATNE